MCIQMHSWSPDNVASGRENNESNIVVQYFNCTKTNCSICSFTAGNSIDAVQYQCPMHRRASGYACLNSNGCLSCD